MPFTKFSNLDFDQIKTSIKEYLRSNSEFSGFDFDGSNFSVLIDTLAYNTYITAFNSNMVVNESFLDSATLRENVVSLARNIGYVPRSRSAAKATIKELKISKPNGSNATRLTIKKGLVCIGSSDDASYAFGIMDDVDAPVDENGVATFKNLEVLQGTFLTKSFTYDGSQDQRFILDNAFIDSSTIRVYVKGEESEVENSGLGFQYNQFKNIVDADNNTRMFLLQEIQDERYELLFGDGIIGKKLGSTGDGSIITVFYMVTDGRDGNGVSNFSFVGTVLDESEVTVNSFTVESTLSGDNIIKSSNGSDIEPLDSIKYYAPRLYSSQYRAVTPSDYEAIIKNVYPDAESITVIGGEELDPPEFGNVLIAIKPKNGTFVSEFNKTRILSDLNRYSVSGINQKIVDVKILYVELDIAAYYDSSKTATGDAAKSKILRSISAYSKSTDINKFGGRFKYSKLVGIVDDADNSITSNITKVTIRRDLKASINQSAQYELCFGNRFRVNADGINIKSTGFKVPGETSTVYLTDIPNADKKTGVISIIKFVGDDKVVVSKSAGTVDYIKGEVILNTITISSTERPDGIIEIQAYPDSNDVVGYKELYLNLNLSKTTINMVRDVISSGEELSGNQFTRNYYTSSYSNGNLIRT